jgi:DNA primase
MPGLKKQRMLYNFDRAITQTSAVIVEGLTDVHMVGAAGMATMGATISPVQAQLLAVNFAGKPIILLYDPEAVEETSRAMSRLMASCTQSPVIDVHLPIGTDPGSTDHNTIWRHIITQAAARGVTVTQCDRY